MRVEFVSREEKRTTKAVTAGSNVAEDQYGNQSSHDAAENCSSTRSHRYQILPRLRPAVELTSNNEPFHLTWRDNESCV